MKTATIKTHTAELLIVELPEGTISYQYSRNLETISAEVPNDKGVSFEQSRIEKGYTLLGKPDEIREEDAKELVENIWNGFKNYSEPHDGNVGNYQRLVVNTAKESLLSLIETEIYWDVNPLDEPSDEIGCECEECQEGFEIKYNDFMIAQEKTFDRNRSLIFFKLLSN